MRRTRAELPICVAWTLMLASTVGCSSSTAGECQARRDCLPGESCVNGVCALQCLDDFDCTATEVCKRGVCAAGSGPGLGDPHSSGDPPPMGDTPQVGDQQGNGDDLNGDDNNGDDFNGDDNGPPPGDTFTLGCTPFSPCSDGDACTYGEQFSASCVCTGGTVKVCTSDTCTTRNCDGSATCAETINTGTPCDDGDACTYTDECSAGGVCVGTSISCITDSCYTRSCDGSATCVSVFVGACAPPSATGSGCGTCKEKTCQANCTWGSCVNQGTGGGCSDGNPCTVNDHCQGGSCVSNGECCGCSTCPNGYWCDSVWNCTEYTPGGSCRDCNVSGGPGCP